MKEKITTRMIRSYLVRCWQETPGSSEGPKWRFALTVLEPKRIWKGFDNLEQLSEHLKNEISYFGVEETGETPVVGE